MQVTNLNVYPLKSGPVTNVSSRTLNRGGFISDRKYMLVDASTGDFISLRDKFSAPLTSLTTTLIPGSIVFSHDMRPDSHLTVPINEEYTTITYRGEKLEVVDCGKETADYFSGILGRSVKLVMAIDDNGFSVDGNPSLGLKNEGLSDGFPFLITNKSSLDYLNEHVEGSALVMQRFRPNIVVDGAAPFDEDSWKIIEINGTKFELPKPCQRCVVTTVDPRSGERHASSEPIRTLNKIRRGFDLSSTGEKSNAKVYFGMNAIPLIGESEERIISTGDTVRIIERYPDVHPSLVNVARRYGTIIP